MRGPGVRLDLDVRRVWKCPACQRLRRVSGDLTAVHCQCAGEPWMQLVEERMSRPRVQQTLEVRELTVDSFQLTEEELAKPLPGRIRRRSGGRSGEEEATGPGNERPGPPSGRNRPSREERPEAGTAGAEPSPNNRARPPRPPRGPKRPSQASHEESLSPQVAPETLPPPAGDDFAAGLDVPTPPAAAEPDADSSR